MSKQCFNVIHRLNQFQFQEALEAAVKEGWKPIHYDFGMTPDEEHYVAYLTRYSRGTETNTEADDVS